VISHYDKLGLVTRVNTGGSQEDAYAQVRTPVRYTIYPWVATVTQG
jgi:hypothetical protein